MHMHWLLTKFPASLNKGDLRVVHEEWNGPKEEIRLGLEVGIEHGNVLALFHVVVLQPFLERAGFVTLPVPSDLVLDVHAFALPFLALLLHQILKTEIENNGECVHTNILFTDRMIKLVSMRAL
ncbi:hypothetical protein EE612_044294 [Oryza sativa]|nr:hypothetical protein EE612_044294 [Oryza sativa]